MSRLIAQFSPDPERQALIAECMESYGIGEPGAEWPCNMISRRAVAFGSGLVARVDGLVQWSVDEAELALCTELAKAAATCMSGADVGMGDEGDGIYRPYWYAANVDTSAPPSITEEYIRNVFGGTIFPPARMTIEPLAEAGEWWERVKAWTDGLKDHDAANYTKAYRSLLKCFSENDFIATAFVMVDADAGADEANNPPGTEGPGCVLPRLAVGLRSTGSLVGIFGSVVHT